MAPLFITAKGMPGVLYPVNICVAGLGLDHGSVLLSVAETEAAIAVLQQAVEDATPPETVVQVSLVRDGRFTMKRYCYRDPSGTLKHDDLVLLPNGDFRDVIGRVVGFGRTASYKIGPLKDVSAKLVREEIAC